MEINKINLRKKPSLVMPLNGLILADNSATHVFS